jgi:hypothetical protein
MLTTDQRPHRDYEKQIERLREALMRIRRLANNPKHQGNAIAEIYEIATMAARGEVG